MIVVVASVLVPVTPSVPLIVALPEIARLPPVIAEVTTKLVNVPVVAKKLVLVAFVNTPVDGVVAPIVLLSIVDPLRVNAATTIASVIELLGSDNVFVTVKLPTLAVPIVELAAVVVANVFTPVKACVAFNFARLLASERLDEERPVIVAPVTLSVDEIVTLVLDTFVIVALLPVSVPIVANVALVVVASV